MGKMRVIDQYRDEETAKRKWDRATLMDDLFIRSALSNRNDVTEFMLKLILDLDLKIVSPTTQKDLPNPFGHSVILDVYAHDDKGNIYDIEIQQTTTNFSPKRSRFYSSLIDMHNLKKNTDYRKLPEKYVIFIMKRDFCI